jgi:hypothetical protein
MIRFVDFILFITYLKAARPTVLVTLQMKQRSSLVQSAVVLLSFFCSFHANCTL